MVALNTFSGTSGVAGQFPATNKFLDKFFIDNLKSKMVFEQFGLHKKIPARNSRDIEFKKLSLLSAAVAALAEGITPDGSQMTLTKTTLTLQQYGDLLYITDRFSRNGEHADRADFAKEQAYQARLTRNVIIRNALIAGANVIFANGSARASCNAPLSVMQIVQAVRYFQRNSVDPVTSMLKGSNKVDTATILPAYIGYCSPDMVPTLRAMDGWVDVVKYGSYGSIYENEIGYIEQVRFIMTPLLQPGADGMSGWADGGATKGALSLVSTTGTSVDIYPTLIMAEEAFAITDGDANAVEVITKPFGAGDDGLNQRASQGWKMDMAVGIINAKKIVRIESAAVEFDSAATLS